VCQFIGHPILLQIRNVVTGVINALFFEVAAENLLMMACLRKGLRETFNQDQETRQTHSELARSEMS